MRETTKKVVHEFGDQEMTFQIRKMNALEGSWLLKFVAAKIMPLLEGLQDVFMPVPEEATETEIDEIAKKRGAAIMTVIPQALESISDEELVKFEKRCLNTVDMLKPAGWQRVMSGDSFGVEEIESDPVAALVLTYDVASFNLSSFFSGKGLSSLLPKQSTSQQNA